MVNFVVSIKPRSYNAKRKECYHTRLITEFNTQNTTHSIYSNEYLYGLIYHFYSKNEGFDADNISKPVWDALQSVVYSNDKQIITRTASSININTHDINLIDFTGIKGSIVTAITSSVISNDHTLYVECGIINKNIWKFNLESL